MDESATDIESGEEPESEEVWKDNLFTDEDFGADDDLEEVEDEDAATLEEGSQPTEGEGDDSSPAEVEADAPKEGPEDGAEATEDVAADTAAEEEAETQESEPEPAPAEAEEVAAEATDTDQTDSEPVWEPFTARADRQDIQLDGAMQTEQGIFIPTATWQEQLQPYLADRAVWERERNQLEARIREKSGAEEEARVIIDHYEEMLGKPVEDQLAWFENFGENRGALLAKAEASREKARADGLADERDLRYQADETADFASNAPERLKRTLTSAIAKDEFSDVSIDAGEMFERLRSMGPEGAFRRTTAYDVQHGIADREGDIIIHAENILNTLRAEATVQRRRTAASAATEAAKKRNASKETGARSTAPVHIPASGTPSVEGEETAEPESKSEWLKGMGIS